MSARAAGSNGFGGRALGVILASAACAACAGSGDREDNSTPGGLVVIKGDQPDPHLGARDAGTAVERPCETAEGPIVLSLLGGADAVVSGVPGTPNYLRRTQEVMVPGGCWSKISISYRVISNCSGTPPTGHNWPRSCDPYDRLTRLTLERDGQLPLVLVHASTPFGGDATWEADVTDYAPLLAGGLRKFSAYISTGADPAGLASGAAASFGVEATLTLVPGKPAREVIAVQTVLYAARMLPDAGSLAGELTPPPGTTSARVDFQMSGHGLGGGQKICDEFCQKKNRLSIAGLGLFAEAPWRDCSVGTCTRVAVPYTLNCGGQSFTYRCEENPTACPSSPTFARSGWCPGQAVPRRSMPLPATPEPRVLRYEVDAMEGWWSASAAVVYFR